MQVNVIPSGALVEVVRNVASILPDSAGRRTIEPDIGDNVAVAECILGEIKMDIIAAGVTVEVALDTGEMTATFGGAKVIGVAICGK